MADSPLSPAQIHLIETHLVLAKQLSDVFYRKLPESLSAEHDDILTVAYQALIAAAQRFDPEWRPDDPRYDPFLAFGAFAKAKIRYAFLDWQRTQDHVPRRVRKTYKELQDRGLGIDRTIEELAELTNSDPEKIRAVVQAVEASAGYLTDNTGASSAESVETSALVSVVQSVVADTLASFPPLQRSVITLRFFRGLDFTAIAQELEVRVITVRTLHAEGVAQLHEAMRAAARP